MDEDVDMMGSAAGAGASHRTVEPAEESYASRGDSAVSPVSVDGADAESMFQEEEECTPHASNTGACGVSQRLPRPTCHPTPAPTHALPLVRV